MVWRSLRCELPGRQAAIAGSMRVLLEGGSRNNPFTHRLIVLDVLLLFRAHAQIVAAVPCATKHTPSLPCNSAALFTLRLTILFSLDGVFYDLGCGTGKPVFAAAAMHPWHRCIGMEILGDLHGICLKALEVHKQGPRASGTGIDAHRCDCK